MLMVLILRDSATWPMTQMTLSWIFSTFWILPLFLLSKIINTFFWQDIADAAFEFRKGKPMHIPSISLLLADVVFSLLVQTLFLVQTMALNLIPYVGGYLSFFSHCLLYSLYSCKFLQFFINKCINGLLFSRIQMVQPGHRPAQETDINRSKLAILLRIWIYACFADVDQ